MKGHRRQGMMLRVKRHVHAISRTSLVEKVVRVFSNMFSTCGQAVCPARRKSRRNGWPSNAGTAHVQSKSDDPQKAGAMVIEA